MKTGGEWEEGFGWDTTAKRWKSVKDENKDVFLKRKKKRRGFFGIKMEDRQTELEELKRKAHKKARKKKEKQEKEEDETETGFTQIWTVGVIHICDLSSLGCETEAMLRCIRSVELTAAFNQITDIQQGGVSAHVFPHSCSLGDPSSLLSAKIRTELMKPSNHKISEISREPIFSWCISLSSL